MHGISIWYELVEHFRAVGQLFVVLAFLVKQSDSLTVASLCVGIAFHVPVDVAQSEQEHTFLYARACGFCYAALIGSYGLRCVASCHVYVAYGIIHLVEKVLVLVRRSHALQSAYHLFGLRVGHNLGHGNACVELNLVGRVLS